ncbi:hypothetical protein COCNU_scaffold014789G000020 [Cocos nucifera]|nr:hypothetical protein [Cocos nucifera]
MLRYWHMESLVALTPLCSVLPIWTWHFESFLGEEVLDVAPLMQSYPSEPFFPTQNLFQDVPFSAFDGDNGFWDYMKCGTENKEKALVCDGEKGGEKKMWKGERRREEKALTFEEVSHYFYMPIAQAAKQLDVGVTLLKRKCRELEYGPSLANGFFTRLVLYRNVGQRRGMRVTHS